MSLRLVSKYFGLIIASYATRIINSDRGGEGGSTRIHDVFNYIVKIICGNKEVDMAEWLSIWIRG